MERKNRGNPTIETIVEKGVKPLEESIVEEANYEEKLKNWDEWDDNNYAARTIMINTMSKAQLLRYNSIKSADKLWSKIK